jgi:hypothetical protein
MSWIRRERKDLDERRNSASQALEKSERDYQEVQEMRPIVQDQVRKHLTLQRENHFAQRLEQAWGQR